MARAQGWKPETLFCEKRTELTRWAERQGTECYDVTPAVLAKLSTRDNPQSVVGVFAQRWQTAEAVQNGVWLALEAVRDPGNLGTILRTADAAGAKGVILVGSCCDPYARESVRASMGSLFAVPLVALTPDAFGTLTRRWPGAVVGTHLAATTDFRQSYPESTLILMGNESTGLSTALANLCTQTVRIPMTGSAESLNLATATALMLYEVRRSALV